VAPGNYIYGLSYTSNAYAGSYWGGTSQATPLVAAIGSLLWAHNPDLTAAQVRQILEETADDQVGDPAEDTPGFDLYMGYGRVNAAAALQSPLAAPQHPERRKMAVLNPVSGNAISLYPSIDGDFTFSICDMAGKEVVRGRAHLAVGNNTIPIALSAGSYVLTVAHGNDHRIFKLLKN
jgi:subtilisin family serine protease